MELRKLWKEVEKRYQMHLAAGERGLSGEIDWVHIIESLQVAEFLRGGELVLTTGMQGKEEQLLKLGKKLWQKEACGLVVNLGPYIKEIPQPLLDFAEEKNFPVFSMPWEVHLVDVTRTICVMLNEYDITERKLIEAVENALYHSQVPEMYLPYMKRFGFSADYNYQIAVMDIKRASQDYSERGRILRAVRGLCQDMPVRPVLFWQEERLVLLLAGDSVPYCREIAQKAVALGEQRNYGLRAGIGPVVTTLGCLPRTYEHAMGTLELARRKQEKLLDYEEMGAYKIIMDVQDRKMLGRFCNDLLGAVMEQDSKKQTDYMEVLREYIETGGSVQEMAERHFCHRNTITYKIQRIKALLNVDLDDMTKRMEILLAFQILDCL